MPTYGNYGGGYTSGYGSYNPWGGGAGVNSYQQQALLNQWQLQNARRTAGQGPPAMDMGAQNTATPGGQTSANTLASTMNQFARPNINVTTGIEAGPVWTPQQVQQGADAIRFAPQTLQGSVANEARNMPQAAQAAASQQLSDATAQGNSMAALQFSRQAALANAKQDLESQRARAFAGGLPWMNLGISDYQSDVMDQMRRGSALAQLLASMV